jgi:hypothetical protein
MAARQCPNCGAMVAAIKITTHSYDLVCANCQHALGISEISRNVAAFLGLFAGVTAWWIVTVKFSGQRVAMGWVWPVFIAYLAASAVAALSLMLGATLELRTADPAPTSHTVHASSHH